MLRQEAVAQYLSFLREECATWDRVVLTDEQGRVLGIFSVDKDLNVHEIPLESLPEAEALEILYNSAVSA